MERFRLSTNERALSPVIGTVLMVGITVTLMAMVGAVVLQGTPAEANSEMEVVTQEEHSNGNTILHIGVASGEGELDLLTGNGGDCDWDGPKDVEMGDNESLTCSDLPEDESVAVIHDGSQSEVVDEITVEPADPVIGNDAEFEVEIDDYDAVVDEGEIAEVTTTVTNIGDDGGEQDIQLEAPNEENGPETVQDEHEGLVLEPGESRTVSLGWEAKQIGNERSYPITVATDDDKTHGNYSVEVDGEPSDPSPDPEPEFVELTAEVTAEEDHPSGNQPGAPSEVTFEYQLSDTTTKNAEFTLDVDDKSNSTDTESTSGPISLTVDVEGNQEDYPANVTASVGETECTVGIDHDDGVVDVC